ncbi:hypothetical protein D3C77_338840 [compost metagenome]
MQCLQVSSHIQAILHFVQPEVGYDCSVYDLPRTFLESIYHRSLYHCLNESMPLNHLELAYSRLLQIQQPQNTLAMQFYALDNSGSLPL